MFRFAAFVAACAAIVWLTRERLLPAPRVPSEPPPHYRSTPPPAKAADDLTVIRGIGPVYSTRLGSIGITTFESLIEVDPAVIADAVGVSTATVDNWIAQARTQVG